MFPRLEYIEWITGRPERAAHDLASSDLRLQRHDPDQVVPDRLAGLSPPPSDVSLEAQLASVYGVDEDEVVVTAGATHAYFLALAAALDDGRSGVAVERPGYGPLWRTPQVLGGDVGRFDRPRTDGYTLSPERVADSAGGDAALVVATNRHNPSGRLADRGTLADAAGAAADAGARLLVDEVYAPYTANADGRGFGGPTAAGLDGAVVTGSLTKFHGLGGLRVGWVLADRPFVERVERAMAHLPVTAVPSRALARRALANRDAIAERAREHLRANHERLAAFVERRPDVDARVHDGAPFAFLAHEAADGDAVADAAWERDVLVVPGRFFEDATRFRVSLGGDPEEMAAALDALGATLDDI